MLTNTHLEESLVGQPPDVQDEIIHINTDARPLALQIALIIPILAGIIGLFTSFRMMRLPDPKPSGVRPKAWPSVDRGVREFDACGRDGPLQKEGLNLARTARHS